MHRIGNFIRFFSPRIKLLVILMIFFPNPGWNEEVYQFDSRSMKIVEDIGAELSVTLDLVKQLGFSVQEIAIEAKLPPKIIITLFDEGDTGRFNNLLIGTPDKRNLSILKTLNKMRISANESDFKNFKFKGFRVTIFNNKSMVEFLVDYLK